MDHELIRSNFVWWQGVVEDRKDPERLGRCRVRVFGFHDKDKNLIPTGELPWASPVAPVDSASISGIGSTPIGPVPGTHVFGFFRDGENAQMPVIMGTIPGIPEDAADTSDPEKAGYQDPDEKYPLDEEDHGLEESDLSRLSRYRWDDEDGAEQKEDELPPLVQEKLDNRVENVPIANGHGSFSEPPTPFDAKYPYNHVATTESGHIIERDDTPGKERTHDYHRSGTFTEIHPFGTKVAKIVRDNYEFVLGDNYINIKKLIPSDTGSLGGNLFLNIEGDVYEFVQGNVERQVNGSVRETIRGNYSTFVNGDRTIGVSGSYAESIQGDMTVECFNELFHTRGKSKKYSEDELTIDSTKNIQIMTIGGNIGLYSVPHPISGLIPGTKAGNVFISGGGSVSVAAKQNLNMFSIAGSVAINAQEGGMSLLANRSMLMKTSAGEMVVNAATTLDIISSKNMKLETPVLCTQRFGNLNTLVDNLHYHKVPNHVRVTDKELVDTSKRDVLGDNLTETFSSTITYRSDGILYMGSQNNMGIKSDNANINMNTGGVINLNGPEGFVGPLTSEGTITTFSNSSFDPGGPNLPS